MPRRKRVAKLRTAPFEYGEEAALYLMTGWDYFNEKPFGDPPDMSLMRDCWQEHRDELLSEYVGDHPGRRPWAWWEFEAPELRPGDEPEPDYLERLGLLLPGERELMEKKKHDHSR